MFGWQVEKLFVVVEQTRIFVVREENVAITRVLVAKKCRFRGKGSRKVVSSVNINFSGSDVGIGKVIDCGRFSPLNKLIRVTGFVLRYVYNLKAFLSGCEVTKAGLLFKEIEK